MNIKELENAGKWAVETFGAADLGDPRRTDRLVKVAAVLGENPSVSLPRSMRNWADTQGTYRFLNNEAVTHEQIMMPHLDTDTVGGRATEPGALDRRHHRCQFVVPQG